MMTSEYCWMSDVRFLTKEQVIPFLFTLELNMNYMTNHYYSIQMFTVIESKSTLRLLNYQIFVMKLNAFDQV